MNADRVIEFMQDGQRHKIVYNDERHAYFLDGKRVPGASTIAGVAYSNADGLMRWAVNEHKEGRDFIKQRDLTAECGQAAHDQLERLAKTGSALDLKDQPERVRGALQAVAKFWLDHQPTFVASEVIVASVKNQYAGRFDAIAEIDGCGLVMLDLKTTGPDQTWERYYKSRGERAFCQMGGYELAWRETDGAVIDGRYVLFVTAAGEYAFEKDWAPRESERAFLAKLDAYRQAQARGKAYTQNRKVAA